MTKWAARFGAFVGVLVLGACAFPTKAGYKKRLSSWDGSDADSLVRSWGQPASSYRMPSGNVVLVYIAQSQYTTPVEAHSRTNVNPYTGSSNTTVTVRGGDIYTFSCKTEFEVESQSHRIVFWRFEGNTCVAPEE